MDMLSAAKALQAKGYDIFATRGTAVFLETNGVHATVLHWPDQDEQPNTLTYIKEKKIDLVVNIPKNLSKDELNNDYTIRRSAIDFNIPLITNARLASAFINAFCRLSKEDVRIKNLERILAGNLPEYLSKRRNNCNSGVFTYFCVPTLNPKNHAPAIRTFYYFCHTFLPARCPPARTRTLRPYRTATRSCSGPNTTAPRRPKRSAGKRI